MIEHHDTAKKLSIENKKIANEASVKSTSIEALQQKLKLFKNQLEKTEQAVSAINYLNILFL